MNTWPLKDIVYVASIIFSLGAVIGTMRYVIKTVERRLDNIFARLSAVEIIAAHNKGRLNGKK